MVAVTEWQPMLTAPSGHGGRIVALIEGQERICEYFRFDNHAVWLDVVTGLVERPEKWRPES